MFVFFKLKLYGNIKLQIISAPILLPCSLAQYPQIILKFLTFETIFKKEKERKE